MRRTFLGLTAAILLVTGAGLSARLIPAAPVTHVRTIDPVAVTTPAQTTSTTIDWRPAVRYTLAIAKARAEHARVVLAIRYAAAVAEQEQLARRLVPNHPAVVPKPPAWKPAWTDSRFDQVIPFACPSLAGAFTAIWGGRAHWADRTASEESGCSPTARNPSPCNSRGDHAVGALQVCGYGGPLDIWSELRAAWQLCLVQPGAWGYHGSCR